MTDSQICLLFGACVSAVGLAMIASHVRKRRKDAVSESLSDEERRFLDRQYRRRMQTSALTVTVGALIGLCGYLRPFRESPIFATCYVVVILGLACWLVLLALGDVAATRVHVSRGRRDIRNSRAALQEAVDELRRRNSESLDAHD